MSRILFVAGFLVGLYRLATERRPKPDLRAACARVADLAENPANLDEIARVVEELGPLSLRGEELQRRGVGQ